MNLHKGIFSEWVNFLNIDKEYRTGNESYENLENANIIGCFSQFADETIKVNNFENLRYLKLPEIYPIDLNGIKINDCSQSENQNSDFSEPIPIKNILEFLVKSNKKLDFGDIVTSMGCLSEIMTTPYDTGCARQNWFLRATKYKGKLYIIHFNVFGLRRVRIPNASPHQFQNFTTFYYNLLECCSTDLDCPGSDANLGRSFHPEDKFSCVYQRKLGDFSLVYGGYIDLVQPEGNTICATIEDLQKMKLSALRIHNLRSGNPMKLLRYNCLFKLGNIKTVGIAELIEDGLMKKPPELIEVSSLRDLSNNKWNESVCVRFLIEFLSKVQDLMTSVDSLKTVYEFVFNSKHGSIKYRILESEQLITNIVPQSYIDFENK